MSSATHSAQSSSRLERPAELRPLEIVLISTYELGRQPFGLASPAAWLRREGASVTCLDLSREPLSEEAVRAADCVAFYLPMHTATRLAVEVLPAVRRLNPDAHLCFYGLYAPVNEDYLRKLGGGTILGGEFEEGLASLARRLPPRANGPGAQPEPVISRARQAFLAPDRQGLPALSRYAHLSHPDGAPRTVGYTEASRGCKHLCRHCPVVPVYEGTFRIVQREVVLEDIRRQVEAGAEHITFGDPDFFNGIGHALAIARALHQEHPRVTYDATIKVEHLLEHSEHLRTLGDTGCLFVTSAAESVEDAILARLEKGHTYEDFVRVVELCRRARLALSPTFVAFTPWTTLEGYGRLLESVAQLGLVEQVAPVQLSIRLLIPAGSRLLELEEVRTLVGEFDEAQLAYPWRHPDPRVDALWRHVTTTVQQAQKRGEERSEVFERVWAVAREASEVLPARPPFVARAAIPYLTEPWYC